MVLNPGKCHYFTVNKGIANECFELGKKTLHAEAEQKLRCTIIDKDFQSYKKSIIKTANQKSSALFRAAMFMTDFNKKVIFNSFPSRHMTS